MTLQLTSGSGSSGLAYDRGGTGSPLLLVHGLGSDRHLWDPITTELLERFDVIRVDLPGHGQSSRTTPGTDVSPDGLAGILSQLLRDLGLTKASVVGSSMGGWIALEMARRGNATDVTALAPAGLWPTTVPPILPHLNRWAAKASAPLAPPLLRIDLLRSLSFWSSSVRPTDLDPEIAVHATRSLARASGWAAMLAATHHQRCDATELSSSIPVTVVWGDRDRILPTAHCQDPTGLPPHARWVRLRSCGHVPMWDQPSETVRLIEETATPAQSKQRASQRTA